MLKVTGYALQWSVKNDKGAIFLTLENGGKGQIPVSSPEELAAVADILRNSPDVNFDVPTETLSTDVKPPGSA